MQAIYLLDVSNQAMHHLRNAYTVLPHSVAFVPDSSLVVVLHQAEDAFEFSIHTRDGQQAASFTDASSTPPSFACTQGGRIAVAHRADFGVHDASTGQLLASFAPSAGAACPACRSGHIAANRTGSRVVFWPQGSSMLHMYDPVLLQAVASLTLPENLTSLPPDAMVWLRQLAGNIILAHSHSMHADTLHVLCLAPSASGAASAWECKQSLQRAERWSGGRAALSPDGAFMASYSLADQALSVHDVRTGQLVLSQAASKPVFQGGVRQCCRISFTTDIRWSACGLRVLVRLTAHKIGDHLIMLQL